VSLQDVGIDSLKAFGDNLILVLTHGDKVTKSGLVVPESAVGQPSKGLVVSAGPGVYNAFGVFVPTRINEGDYVLFIKPQAKGIEIGGQWYVTCKESAVMAVVGEYTEVYVK
jgi:chaperonin GroES